MTAQSSTDHFSRGAIAIHWLSVLLVLGLMITGLLSDRVEGDAKQMFLMLHLPFGLLLLALTVFRLFWWWRLDTRPQALPTAKDWQQRLSRIVHGLLYVTLIVMLASGIGLSVLSGAPDAVFGSAPMPDFWTFLPRTPHGIASKVLGALILMHAGAALMHHFVEKDETLRRMWFRSSKASVKSR